MAGRPGVMPDQRPHGREDFDKLRWSVRSDGRSGFVFVNNYQRGHPMPARADGQFVINLPDQAFTFPEKPAVIPADNCLIWPFNMDLGNGVNLRWATAQPLTAADDGKMRTVFFAATAVRGWAVAQRRLTPFPRSILN